MMLIKNFYRPEFHFSPVFGWMNDPNGLVKEGNIYHMFYQFYPFDNTWGAMHWGHAISRDLLNWTQLMPALCPDDKGMCFSGSAVIDENNTTALFPDASEKNILAIYTQNQRLAYNKSDQLAVNTGLSEKFKDEIQSQCLAYKDVNTGQWKKYSGNPVLEDKSYQDFRDPKVIWSSELNSWIMVVTVGGGIGFYRSSNLKGWEKLSVFSLPDEGTSQLPWECPDLFPIKLEGTETLYWILVVSVQKNSPVGGSATRYFIGNFDGKNFEDLYPDEEALWVDSGRDFYAMQTWSNVENDRRLAIAWMSNWQYTNEVPTTDWRGAMSVPRELTLVKTPNGIRLKSGLPKEWTFTSTVLSVTGSTFKGECDLCLSQEPFRGIMSLECELDMGSSLIFSPFGDRSLRYSFTRTENGLSLVSSRHCVVDGGKTYQEFFPHRNEIFLPQEKKLSFDVVIDSCSCELFLKEGEIVCTDLAFPDSQYPATIQTTGTIKVKKAVRKVLNISL